ncbi:MAG: YkgJ family cysteine cluster protein [Campylobacterales bacterium]
MIEKDGFDFSFDPKGCSNCEGYCCSGESGYIWLSKKEIEDIAVFLGVQVGEFLEHHCIKVGYKYSLKEYIDDKKGSCCIFFDTITNRCSVYEVRPSQCKKFPFWDSFKQQKNKVFTECPYTYKL